MISAYTDGSCLGNPGVGGYGAYLVAETKDGEKAVKKCCGLSTNPHDTNNRMELMAVICVIQWCNRVQKSPCHVTVHTDSQYLIAIARKKRGEIACPERSNNDLWVQLITECEKGGHKIKFVKVQGHSDDEMNEAAHQLATAKAKEARHIVFGAKK